MADLSTLITTDHTIFDGVQTITLKNQAGTSSDTVAYVTSGPVSFKAMQLIGGLEVTFTNGVQGDVGNLDPVNVSLTAPEITHSITPA